MFLEISHSIFSCNSKKDKVNKCMNRNITTTPTLKWDLGKKQTRDATESLAPSVVLLLKVLLLLVSCSPMRTGCGRMLWYAGLWPVPRWAPAHALKLHRADGCWGIAGGAAWPSPSRRQGSAEPDSTPPAPAVGTRSSWGTGSPCSLQEPAEDGCVRISGLSSTETHHLYLKYMALEKCFA